MSLPVSVLCVRAEGVAPEALRPTADLLARFDVPHREITLSEDGALPDTRGRAADGTRIFIVASAGTKLPAGLSAVGVPVIRVPVEGADSTIRGLGLLAAGATEEPQESRIGEGFATVALGHAGAVNAALLAVAMLSAQGDERLRAAWSEYREVQTRTVLEQTLPVL